MIEKEAKISLNHPNTSSFDPFSGPKIERVVCTTRSQEEIWTGCKLSGDNANKAYNESISLKLIGDLKIKALKQALQTLIQRHESLRSTFSTDGRFMTIFSELETKIEFLDISDLQEDLKKHALSEYLKADANHLFDLNKGPLLKPGIIKTSFSEHIFVITAHHIVCDGWSIGIMLQDLGALYSAFATNKAPKLPEPESFYSYADEQNQYTHSSAYNQTEQYWLDLYKNDVPLVDLPTDYPRPANREFSSARLDFPMDSDLLESLKKTGVNAGCSLVSSLLSSFEVFLHQLINKDDLVVGLPAAGQSAAGKMQLVGHCVNILPLRSKLNSKTSFNTYLKKRKTELFDAYEHQQFSVGHLLQKLPIARDAARVPLVPVVFNIDLGLTDGVNFEGLTYELTSNPREFETFEIFLNASGDADGLVFEWSYNTALFKASTIQKMMLSFESLLKKLVENPDEMISKIATSDYSSKYKNLNNTCNNFSSLALPDLIKEQVKRTPNNSALVYNNTELSYVELQSKVNQLSNYLIESGIKPGDLIGVSLQRSAELPILLLAILQSSAAFVPIDPKYPAARLEYMLEDSETKFLITSKEISAAFPATINLQFIEDLFVAAKDYSKKPIAEFVAPETLAYHIYTSGSTGKPKGVQANHKSLVNFLCSMAKEPGLTEEDRVLSVTSMSFDPVFLELFLPLITGATIVLANDEMARDGRLLLDFLKTESITMLQATPTTWQMLIDVGWKKPLPLKALCGGEALTRQLANQLLERSKELWNIYGPTETTVWSVINKINSGNDIITIGKPIANMQLYLLDNNNQLVAPGDIGEICIAGAGMTLGYWNRPDLNKKLFIENPFSQEYKLLYKSGDLGKLLPNGEIQCLGRVDHQIKIRGYRIEPGEIENAIMSLDGVQNAVVVAHSNKLRTYVVPCCKLESDDNQINVWRKTLKLDLPPHYIPQEFIVLDELPKTPNGKIDRKSLMEPKEAELDIPTFTSPASKNEQLVAKIWQSALEIEDIDVNSNFFEMGGHSIIAVKVMTLIEEKTGKRLPLSSLFEHSTIKKLAKLLDANTEIKTNSVIVPIKPKGNKPPLFIVHGAGLNVLIFNEIANQLDPEQPVYGIQGQQILPKDKPLPTIEEIATKYVANIIEAHPEGPYALAGYSLGGYIAYEMAKQLKLAGKNVSMLAILDTYVDPHFNYSSPIRKQMATTGYHIERLTNLLKEMTTSFKDLKYHTARKIKEIFFGANRYTDEDEMKNQGHNTIDKRVFKIMNNYHIIPDDIQIDLLRAEEKIYHLHDPKTLGWQEIALAGVEIHNVPGHHLNMLVSPNAKTTGKTLQNVLDQRN
ncbi:amino acid adenylation domain-containing protein [Aurantibacter sp.]|uniref:non-ribosomal peptide synthetase n=1 Tax=Aurantibacter sp. TaxID=2807103 RepID=UPI003263CAF7